MECRGEGASPAPVVTAEAARRYAAWFHELDAWTEYWDIYHPETAGRYYFGDDRGELGLLRQFLPREHKPPVFNAWVRMALGVGNLQEFSNLARVPDVAAPVIEVDQLVARLFAAHFGDPSDPAVRADYIEALLCFACDCLPPAAERNQRISAEDPRKPTAGRHTLDGDIMWFAWALQVEAAHAIAGTDQGHARRALQLACVAIGCPANFAWRGHRRTRAVYRADEATLRLLRARAAEWSNDFAAAAAEVHALYRIREWGTDE
jgi:hypothetical protein